ncbi:MAG: hypothetical protein PHQ19_01825 [Candidatus Krumholzibacteria bacterium]|nr:hypothetical protein [Candidatus Krumholzibacteria bacterium]
MCAIEGRSDFERGLLAAARRVREAFLACGGGRIGEAERRVLEEAVKRDMLVLYKACYAFAVDIVTARVKGRFHLDGGEEVGDLACEAVLPLFGHRRRSTGCLAIVGTMNSLFEKNPAPTGEDVVRWLRATVNRLVDGVKCARLYESNPEYVKTARKIDRYVRNSGRFVLADSIVRDALVELDPADLRRPSASEIVSLCGSASSIPASVPAAVDLIFDLLADDPRFRSAVELQVLREAAFRVLDPRLPGLPHQRRPVTPYEEYLLGRAADALEQTLSEAERGYSWRNNFSEAERCAFIEAGRDYLYDLAASGRATQSERSLLAAHLAGCTSAVYETAFKGSFHNFLLYLGKAWRARAASFPAGGSGGL